MYENSPVARSNDDHYLQLHSFAETMSVKFNSLELNFTDIVSPISCDVSLALRRSYLASYSSLRVFSPFIVHLNYRKPSSNIGRLV